MTFEETEFPEEGYTYDSPDSEPKAKPDKPRKINLKCVICGSKVSLTPDEIKTSKNYDQFIIRYETDEPSTMLQAGTLCDSCLEKPLEKRVIVKRK